MKWEAQNDIMFPENHIWGIKEGFHMKRSQTETQKKSRNYL